MVSLGRARYVPELRSLSAADKVGRSALLRVVHPPPKGQGNRAALSEVRRFDEVI
jgi:hypothetical protein